MGTNELMHPQAVVTFNGLGIEKLIRQLFSIIAIIEALEVDNETILLWANRGNGERAVPRWFNNGEGGTNSVTRRNIRSERNEEVSTDTMRFTDATDLEEAIRRSVSAQR